MEDEDHRDPKTKTDRGEAEGRGVYIHDWVAQDKPSVNYRQVWNPASNCQSMNLGVW